MSLMNQDLFSTGNLVNLLLLLLIGLVAWSAREQINQARNHTDIGDRNLAERLKRIEEYLDYKLKKK